ncbi:N-acetylmuramoyl-L-alanine amidase family protein [Brevibacillus daliensis]|uniref:N-acetylmuramoyl-L-alanine amidase family protein n=1 Tax=Brevibacillus daliensis TaxID=2892995 RepID=UPI001E4179DD|nr:N-acetylmuramoyl-L-alanine amidase family protein [Brevibacillus daliensis]
MKKFVLGVLALGSFLWLGPQGTDAVAQAAVANDINLRIEGKVVQTEVPPSMSNGRTLVPVRVVAEGLGADVDWNQKERKATITKDGRTIVLQTKSKKAYIDGKLHNLDAVPELVNNRMLLPLRFVGEALGTNIGWDNDTRTVLANEPIVAVVNGEALPASEQLYRWDDKVLLPVKAVADKLGVKQEDIWNKATFKKNIDSNTPVVSLEDIESSLKLDVVKWDKDRNQVIIQKVNKLQDVYVEKTDIHVATSSPVVPKASVLQDPYRIVLDLPSTELSSSLREGLSTGDIKEVKVPMTDDYTYDLWNETGESKEPLIRTVRYSQYQSNPHVVRVVVELSRAGDYDIVNTNEGFTLKVKEKPAKGKFTIVVDAGHGGSDVGAIGTQGNYEKDFTLAVSNYLIDYLKKHKDFEVIATRTTDVYPSLQKRVEIANNAGADMFISIHANSFSPTTQGTETYYYNQNSSDLAKVVHKHLVNATGFPDRKVKQSGFYVIKNTKMPAVLTETGFLSNSYENSKLMSPQFQDKVAKALADAIVEYYQTY